MPLPITLLPTPLPLPDITHPTLLDVAHSAAPVEADAGEPPLETEVPPTQERLSETELIRPMDNDAAASESGDTKDISSLSVKELRNLCVTRGLPNTGKKNEMIERLTSNVLDEVALIDDV